MNRTELVSQIKSKRNYLCIGLDTDIDKIPTHLLSEPDPVFLFNKQIIDATKDYCVSYKINTAFYEAMGIKGWEAMQKTVEYIPSTHFSIADAKRGDIGNTSAQYAKAFFDTFGFDAITVAPYMGSDSIQPFLNYKDKWTIVLALTSNKGSQDFEQLVVQQDNIADSFLFETVMKKVASWGTPENLMFVLGATKADHLAEIRTMYPDHFFLVPGVGFQGGSLAEVSKAALTEDGGILVNVSRAIIYAGADENFAEEAMHIAAQYDYEMKEYI